MGSFLNHKPISVSLGRWICSRWISIEVNRVQNRLVNLIVDDGGVFYRNASGALSLAYVALED